MNDEAAVRAAHRAQQELTQTEAAFTGLRQAMIDQWSQTASDQEHKREKLFLAVQTLDAVRKALLETVAAGEVANYVVELAKQGLTSPHR
jgi:hypothetical protein